MHLICGVFINVPSRSQSEKDLTQCSLKKSLKIQYFLYLAPQALLKLNKARYTATPVARGWAGAVFEVTSSFGQQ